MSHITNLLLTPILGARRRIRIYKVGILPICIYIIMCPFQSTDRLVFSLLVFISVAQDSLGETPAMQQHS